MIRPLRRDDAPWAARQHADLMRGSVFAAMGAGFLECFYERFAASPHALAYVWEDAGRPRAVIAAVSRRGRFLADLVLRHGARLAFFALRGLLRPACRRLYPRLLGYPRRGEDTPIEAEMIFITVAPEIREKGVARELIRTALAEYARRGVPRVHVTIERENGTIRRVLEGLGFGRVRSFAFAGKEHDLLQCSLAPAAGTGGAP
jgi:ribosomal protein S18 acetylase RimI-like enzyme